MKRKYANQLKLNLCTETTTIDMPQSAFFKLVLVHALLDNSQEKVSFSTQTM